ncbi:MAG TPA: hypothetical protein VFE29_08535 [Terriglobia bacterium]|nr:hypothetical protein [Terriglobia bacterium]
MRAYTVAAVAVTLKVSPKWIDNVLSHHRIDGVSRTRQGVSRRLTPKAVTTLEIALQLLRSASLPVARALEIAHALAQSEENPARVSLSSSVAIVVDVASINAETARRLADAVEITPRPRRGRPPR